MELNPVTTNFPLNFAQFNSQSIHGTTEVDKPSLIQNYIIENKIDLLALSETWLKPDSLVETINSITPDGYLCMHVPRVDKRGGGVAFIYRSTFDFRLVKYPVYKSFEMIVGKLVCKSSSFLFANVYRPPTFDGKSVHDSVNAFLDEFSSVLEDIGTTPSEIFLSGDYNIHVDNLEDSYTEKFMTLLEMFNLKQLIDFSTHKAGHTLDLFITRSETTVDIKNFLPTIFPFSDHTAVSCDISIKTTPRLSQISKTVRFLKHFNATLFTSDLLKSGINYISDVDLDLYVNSFMTTIKSIFDKHAPWKTVKCSEKISQPFFTRELRDQKRLRSRLESKWRRSRTIENKNSYMQASKHFAVLLREAKRNYYRGLINKNSLDSKKLWSTLNSVIGNKVINVLPAADFHWPSHS